MYSKARSIYTPLEEAFGNTSTSGSRSNLVRKKTNEDSFQNTPPQTGFTQRDFYQKGKTQERITGNETPQQETPQQKTQTECHCPSHWEELNKQTHSNWLYGNPIWMGYNQFNRPSWNRSPDQWVGVIQNEPSNINYQCNCPMCMGNYKNWQQHNTREYNGWYDNCPSRQFSCPSRQFSCQTCNGYCFIIVIIFLLLLLLI